MRIRHMDRQNQHLKNPALKNRVQYPHGKTADHTS